MSEILITWIGATDLRAGAGEADVGLGPIGQAVEAAEYDEVVLLSDYPSERSGPYAEWLAGRTSAQMRVEAAPLSGPTDFGEIHQAASKAVQEALERHGQDAHLTFHLSPGTPAMAAMWILLAKTSFPADMIESSREHGVRKAFVPFDISAEFLPGLLRRADGRLEGLAAGLPEDAPEFESIIHRSEAMRHVILLARRVAPRSIPVVLEGESGTGKEMLSRAIHAASPRNGKAFVAINCGAIPAELVESELFGHERGAFTGAGNQRKGYFEEADGGTLFLDEIGELPKAAQVKLLRVLQEGEVVRVGGTRPKKIDVRIIAATNRSLISEISEGNFREDLFYRLAVAVIKIPPLRDREGDVGLLVDRLLERINQEGAAESEGVHKKVSVNARNLLIKHPWLGNVRELANTLTRAAVWSMGDTLTEADIADALLPPPCRDKFQDQVLDRPLEKGVDLPSLIQEVARHYLKRGLEETRGNKTKTAQILGLPSYQTLTNWLKKYGLE